MTRALHGLEFNIHNILTEVTCTYESFVTDKVAKIMVEKRTLCTISKSELSSCWWDLWLWQYDLTSILQKLTSWRYELKQNQMDYHTICSKPRLAIIDLMDIRRQLILQVQIKYWILAMQTGSKRFNLIAELNNIFTIPNTPQENLCMISHVPSVQSKLSEQSYNKNHQLYQNHLLHNLFMSLLFAGVPE